MLKNVPKKAVSTIIMVAQVLRAATGQYFTIAEIKAKINEMYSTDVGSDVINRAIRDIESITPHIYRQSERKGPKKIPVNKYAIIFNE